MEMTEAPEIPASEEVPVETVKPEVTEDLEQEITKDIETGKKPKKPRSEKQKAAFVKARQALAEKRKAAAQEKTASKKKPGRPPKTQEEPVKEQPKVKPQKKEKKVQYVLEEPDANGRTTFTRRAHGMKKSHGAWMEYTPQKTKKMNPEP